MCIGKKPAYQPVTQKVTAAPAAAPKNNNPELELASVETNSDMKKKKSGGKRGLRVGLKQNNVGTSGLGPKAITIPT